MTGRPSAGKSTLAEGLRRELARCGHVPIILDGDEVRAALVPQPGYDDEARAAFYATLSNLAALLCGQGIVVVVAATAHLASFREHAREKAAAFIEVYVDTPSWECERRDAKGLHKLAREGKAPHLEDVTAGYEVPSSPEVVAHGGLDRVALARVVELVARRRP